MGFVAKLIPLILTVALAASLTLTGCNLTIQPESPEPVAPPAAEPAAPTPTTTKPVPTQTPTTAPTREPASTVAPASEEIPTPEDEPAVAPPPYAPQGTDQLAGGGFVSVSAGEQHTCGIRLDETIACWGANGHGQALQGGLPPSARATTSLAVYATIAASPVGG